MRILNQLALVIALASAACSSTPGNGGTNGGSSTNGTGTGGTGGTGGGGGTGTGIEKASRIVVSDDQTAKEYQTNSVVKIAVAGLNPGETIDTRINVGNIGNTALTFKKVAFAYEAGAPDENPLAFACDVDDGSGTLLPCDQAQAISPKATRQFVIHFTKPTDDKSRVAELVLSTNDPKMPTFKLKFASVAGLARVTLQKEVLDFGFPKPGSDAVQQTQLTSSGASVLKIDEVDSAGLDGKLFEVLLVANIGGKELKAPFELAPGDSANVIVTYKGNDTNPHVGDIVFKTNDSSLSNEGGPGWKRLKVKVNSTGPCLKIEPSSINFPMTGVGQTTVKSVQLSVCGNEQVCITEAPFDSPGAGPFALNWAEAGGVPTKDKPVCIGVAKAIKLGATYKPTGVSPKGSDGNLVPDTATFVVKSNAAAGAIKVPMTGLAGSGDCPTGVITVAEGDTVTPQTVLHLDGTQSFAAGATIKSYKWSVVQPKGSVSTFTPNTTAAKVVFTPNVAGDYTFQLTVVDSDGKNACAPAIKVVHVLPDQAIHVELLWNTPADKDQTDEGPDAGADMDLHFAHPYATMTDADKDGSADPWFSDAYDCYWYTCATSAGKDLEWGSYDPNVDDNPHLDRDDTDGGGPENMNLTLPQDEKTYAVGVHYFKDHGFGASTATVKIYIFGELMWEKTSTSMLPGDFWYAAQVAWPNTEICSVTSPGPSTCQGGQPGNTLFITPKYPTPPL